MWFQKELKLLRNGVFYKTNMGEYEGEENGLSIAFMYLGRPCSKYWRSIEEGGKFCLVRSVSINRVAHVVGWLYGNLSYCFSVNSGLKQRCWVSQYLHGRNCWRGL